MSNAILEWKERINACHMPILQSTADYFLERKPLPATSISNLWKHLKYDPGLCLNLLRAAGHSRRTRVKTVSHAMLLLGLPNVLNRPEDLPRVDAIKDIETRRLILSYFSKGYHASIYAKQWWKLKKEKNLEEIQAASLNSYFMEYLLCLCQPDLMLKLEQQIGQGPKRQLIEKKLLGFSIKELAYEIARDWHLPELMIESLADKPSKSDKVNYVILSRQLVDETQTGWYHSGTETIINTTSEFIKKPHTFVATHIHKTTVKIARSSYPIYSNISPTATTLIQWPQVIVKKPIKSKKPLDRKEILKRCLYQLSHNPNLDQQKIIQYVFKGMNQGLGLNRVFFALLTEDKRHLQVKFSIDHNNQNLKRLRFSLTKGSLFTRIMRKPQALWMNDKNREKYWLTLPKSYVESINNDAFFIMSLFIHGKPVGLFYADMNKGNILTETQFKYFKRLCQLSSAGLEILRKNKHNDYTEKKVINA